MNKMDYKEMIIRLKQAKIQDYSLDDFREYLLTEEEWNKTKSKRERALKRTYIVVYDLFENRLLARTFYLEEGFCRKERYEFITEVERQLAGCPYILTKNLYTVMGSQGFRVWKGIDTKGWTVRNHGSHKICGLYSNWTGETYSYIETFNDYLPFLKHSIHKYSSYELIPEKEQNNNYMFEFLFKYEKHPQIEMLVKLNLFHLLKEDLRYIKWTKKGPAMLGITKPELKYLQRGLSIPNYRKVRETVLKHHLNVEECEKAVQLFSLGITDVKTIKYVAKKNVFGPDYRDYIDFLTQLGVPKQPKYLYPVNFKEEHDKRMKEVKEHEGEITSKAIERFAKDLEELAYNGDGLIITPARTQEELINESEVLEHCVRTYANKVAKRQTAIFFIREEEHKEIPFVTLELKDKKVIQCRAKHNSVPNAQTLEFVRHWAKMNELECRL